MTRTIRLFASLRDLAGASVIEVSVSSSATVRDLAAAIQKANASLGAELLNEDGSLSGRVQFLVNGRNVLWLEGLDTLVSEDDDLVLVPPVAGG